jgi:hypothetical protein
MDDHDREKYVPPTLTNLGSLADKTKSGDVQNSDAGPWPRDNNPSDAYGPYDPS